MIANIKSSPSLIPAIYKHGVFEPAEPIPGLGDDQPVQLLIWPVFYDEATLAPIAAEQDGVDESAETAEADEAYDAEWAALMPLEQQGRRVPFSPGDESALLQWVQTQWASLALSEADALEIATADWLLEENLCLSSC